MQISIKHGPLTIFIFSCRTKYFNKYEQFLKLIVKVFMQTYEMFDFILILVLHYNKTNTF